MDYDSHDSFLFSHQSSKCLPSAEPPRLRPRSADRAVSAASPPSPPLVLNAKGLHCSTYLDSPRSLKRYRLVKMVRVWGNGYKITHRSSFRSENRTEDCEDVGSGVRHGLDPVQGARRAYYTPSARNRHHREATPCWHLNERKQSLVCAQPHPRKTRGSGEDSLNSMKELIEMEKKSLAERCRLADDAAMGKRSAARSA